MAKIYSFCQANLSFVYLMYIHTVMCFPSCKQVSLMIYALCIFAIAHFGQISNCMLRMWYCVCTCSAWCRTMVACSVLGCTTPPRVEEETTTTTANGRLAMMAIIGMFFQDGLTGSAWGDWANYTASPLRAGFSIGHQATCMEFSLYSLFY